VVALEAYERLAPDGTVIDAEKGRRRATTGFGLADARPMRGMWRYPERTKQSPGREILVASGYQMSCLQPSEGFAALEQPR